MMGGGEGVRVYRPSRSWGRVWLGVPGALLLLEGVAQTVWAVGIPGDMPGPARVVVLLTGLLLVGVGGAFLLMAVWMSSMRYELDDRRLLLRCGPFRYAVSLPEVRRVVKRDLAFSPWSSLRLPGFALGEVIYADAGRVVMCATRALKGIILLETERRKYGITPADEEAFLADLGRRLDRLGGGEP